MSFAFDLKSELCKTENREKCCDRAELCGIICFSGNLVYENGIKIIKIASGNESVYRRCIHLLKRIFPNFDDIKATKSRMSDDRYSYKINIYDKSATDIITNELMQLQNGVGFSVNENITKKPCCKRAFIRGAFLGGGFICAPDKAYHVEFITRHTYVARDFEELLTAFSLCPKIVMRKSNYMIYFKGGDEIEDVLNVMGARRILMDFMNVRIIKETRNNLNRKLNCESANEDKTINASINQVKAIEKLQRENKLMKLPPQLYELALLRLKNKTASLSELGKMLTPPMTRSGVNHRMKKILEAANE